MNIPDPPWVQDLNNRASKIEKDLDSTIRNVQQSDEYLRERIGDLDGRLMAVERHQLWAAPQKRSDLIPKHVLLDWLDEVLGTAEEGTDEYETGLFTAVDNLRKRLANYEA